MGSTHFTNDNEDSEDRIFIDKFEQVENECKRLKRMLPDDVIVMLVKKADLNFFLEGLQAAPLMFVLWNDGGKNE